MRSRIMYIEGKAGSLSGSARIGRVTFSKTGRTIYYDGRSFQTLRGRGFKSNYVDLDTGEGYWISGPRRDGADRLYGERAPVEIDGLPAPTAARARRRPRRVLVRDPQRAEPADRAHRQPLRRC